MPVTTPSSGTLAGEIKLLVAQVTAVRTVPTLRNQSKPCMPFEYPIRDRGTNECCRSRRRVKAGQLFESHSNEDLKRRMPDARRSVPCTSTTSYV